MPQHRHLTGDIAEVLTLSEYYINQMEAALAGTETYERLASSRKELQDARWKCINKGYYDVESGWHKRKDK